MRILSLFFISSLILDLDHLESLTFGLPGYRYTIGRDEEGDHSDDQKQGEKEADPFFHNEHSPESQRMAGDAGVEPTAFGSGDQRSIQLS